MSEEPVIELLARFTPAPTALDRDGLLAKFGRATAPKTGPWKLATAVLLASQIGTAGLWILWPREAPAPATNLPIAPIASEPPRLPNPSPEPLSPDSYASLLRSWDASRNPLPPKSDAVPAGKPLTAGSNRSTASFD